VNDFSNHPGRHASKVVRGPRREVLSDTLALDVNNGRGVGSVKAIIVHPRSGALMGGVSPTRDSYVVAY
jgi:hypothetical protein